jgi:hypothetical protein
MRIPQLVGLGLLCTALATPVFATDLTATGDTYTQGSSPTANFGSSGITAVAVDRVTLIQFDPAAVAQSSGAQALLKIKVLVTKNFNDGVTAHLVTSAWSEKTVTEKTLPSIASAVLDQKTITAANKGQVVSFDVTGALAGWRSNPGTNFGIALVAGSPIPNLELGSREGGSPAILSLGGVVADNDVTVAVSGGDYPDPQTAANNAFDGDKWCVSAQPPAKPCTIHVKAGIYPHGGVTLPPGLALIGEERGSTILIGNLGSSGLVSDLTIQGSVSLLSAQGAGITNIEFDRVSINSRDLPEDVIGPTNAGVRFTLKDSDITVINSVRKLPIFLFDCESGGCVSIKLVHCRITMSSQSDIDTLGFVYAQDEPQSLDIEDSSISISGPGAVGILSSGEGLDVTVSGGQMTVVSTDPRLAALAIKGDQGGDSLQVLNATINGGIDWQDSGSVTLDGAAVDRLGVGTPNFGGIVPVSILRSVVNSLGVGSATLDVESSVVGTLGLSGSKGTLSSSQVTGTLTLGPDDKGTPSSATCNRVFDGQLKLLPPTCVSH